MTDVRRLWRPMKHVQVDWDGLEGKEMENEELEITPETWAQVYDGDLVEALEVKLEPIPKVVVEVEYAVFNDPEVWEPLFASGALHVSQRFQLDEPLFTSASLWTAYRWQRLHDEERAEQAKVDTYGHLVLRKRTVTRTPWTTVTYDEVDEVRRA